MMMIVMALIGDMMLVGTGVPSRSVRGAVVAKSHVFKFHLTCKLGLSFFKRRVSGGVGSPRHFSVIVFGCPSSRDGLFVGQIVKLPKRGMRVGSNGICVGSSRVPLSSDFIPRGPENDFNPCRIPRGDCFILNSGHGRSGSSHY